MARSDIQLAAASRGKLKRHRIHERLEAELRSGRLRPGQSLPTEIDMSRQMQVSRNTVRHALAELEKQGLVRRVQGKGTFLTEKVDSQASAQTGCFALVVLDVLSNYYHGLFAAFERSANEIGRPVVICNSDNNVDRQGNHILALLHQRAAGVVLNPSNSSVTPTYHVEMLQNSGIPVVLLHRRVPKTTAPVLAIPGAEIGRLGGKLLVDAGHRRVAFLDSARESAGEYQSELIKGLREALAEVDADLPDDCIDFGDMTEFNEQEYHRYEAYLEELIPRLMSRKAPPTALFIGWTEFAEHVYLLAMRMGVRVPEDLSIVCYGSASKSGAIRNRLTTISLDEAAVAERAVQILEEMRSGHRALTDAEVIPLPLMFSSGNTLGPPAPSK